MPVIVCLVLLALSAQGAAARLSLRSEGREGRTVHILTNGGRQWLIDPADGASVHPVEEGEPAGGSNCVLLQDRWGDRVIPYTVGRAISSGATAFVMVEWKSPEGLSVEKTVSALVDAQTVQVSYRIANGSDQPQAFQPWSRANGTDRPWALAVRGREGMARSAADAAGQVSVHDYVEWFALADPDGASGFAVGLGAGLARRLRLHRAGGSVELAAETSLVPAGHTLSAAAWIASVEGLGLPTGVSPLLLGNAAVAQAGETVRFNAELLPLAFVGPGRAVLSVRDSEGQQVARLEGPPGELASGTPVSITFYWTTPESGEYDIALEVPSLGRSLILGRCVVADGRIALVTPRRRSVRKATFGRVANWAGLRPPVPGTSTEPPTLFIDGEGPVERIVVDVGIEESETVLLAPGPALLQLESPALELGDLSTRRAERRLSRSAITRFEVAGSFVADPFKGGGLMRRLTGPVWQLQGAFGLRIDVPSVPADTYSSELAAPALGKEARVPLDVRVWPVKRPRPGPVRLLVLQGGETLGGRWAGERLPTGVSAVGQPAPFADLALWRAMAPDGGDVSADDQLEAVVPESPPPLHFSGADLGKMIANGTSDVVVVCPSDLPGDLGDAYSGPLNQESAYRLWRELAVQVTGNGFGRPLLAAPVPLPGEAITTRWLQAAGQMAAAGWSVCGPITGGLPDDELIRELADVTDTLVFEGASAGDLAKARSLLGESGRVGVWLPLPAPGASYAEGLGSIRGVPWREADVVMMRPRSDQRTAASTSALSPWLFWEGVRDGLDEVNYLRMLWDMAGESAGAGERSTQSPKRRLLARLSTVIEELSANGIDLSWRGHGLVARGRARAIIAIDPAFGEQAEAAHMLNQIVLSRSGAVLPVVDLNTAASAPSLSLAITCGTVSTNRMIRELAGRRSDELAWRAEKNGCWLAHYRVEGTDWLVLATADPEDWGRAVARFGAMLREHYGGLFRD